MQEECCLHVMAEMGGTQLDRGHYCCDLHDCMF